MSEPDGFEAGLARLKRSANEFSSQAFDRDQRLRAMEIHVYGPSVQHATEPLFTSLSSSNENYIKHQRVVGNDIVVSRTTTSGFNARSGTMLSDVVMINTCLSGGISLGSDKIRNDDIYISLSEVGQRQYGPGVYQRLVFPNRRLKVRTTHNNQLLIFRRNDPVNQVIRSAADGVEKIASDGIHASAPLVEELMVAITQRILDNALSTVPTAGYNHIRDRAIEYIRDNIHRPNLSVAEVARYTNVSRATLYRAFETIGGLKHFISAERISLAKSMLRLGHAHHGQISIVAYNTGFTSPERFSKVFKSHTGLTPTQFVENA